MSEKVKLSYSRVSQYLVCPKRVEFDLKGVKTPITAPLALGSILHHAISEVISGKKAREVVLDAVARIESGQPLTKSPFREEPRWNGELVITSRDDRPRDMVGWLTAAVDLVTAALGGGAVSEVPLKRDMGDYILVGVVDAFFRGLIIDFKLVSPKSRGGSKLQAACYSILSGGPTRFQFWLIRKRPSPELERMRVPEAEDSSFLEKVHEFVLSPVAEGIASGRFPANPDHFLCQPSFCLYWKICPFGGRK